MLNLIELADLNDNLDRLMLADDMESLGRIQESALPGSPQWPSREQKAIGMEGLPLAGGPSKTSEKK